NATRGNGLTVKHPPGPVTATSATTTYAYEPTYSRITMIKEPMQTSQTATTYAYNDLPVAPTETITDPMERATIITLKETTGQVASVQDPLGNTTTYTYDAVTGDPRTVRDPLTHTTYFGTDNLGRTTWVQTPLQHTLGVKTSYTYDDFDNVKTATVPHSTDTGQNSVTTNLHDLLGELIKTTDPNGNVTTITIPASLDSTTVCDSLTPPQCSIDQRDTNGRRTWFQDKREVKTTYNYDQLGRVTSVVYNSNNHAGFTQRTVSFAYHSADRPPNITDSASPGGPAIRYSYDDGADAVDFELTREGQVSYAYDLNGRRTSMTSLAGTVSYTYYPDDRLNTATSSSPALSAALTSDNDARRQTLTITSGANTVTTSYDNYDAASRLTGVSYKYNTTTLGNLHYTYDNDDRIIGVGGTYARTNLPATATATYTPTNQVQTW